MKSSDKRGVENGNWNKKRWSGRSWERRKNSEGWVMTWLGDFNGLGVVVAVFRVMIK